MNYIYYFIVVLLKPTFLFHCQTPYRDSGNGNGAVMEQLCPPNEHQVVAADPVDVPLLRAAGHP